MIAWKYINNKSANLLLTQLWAPLRAAHMCDTYPNELISDYNSVYKNSQQISQLIALLIGMPHGL